MTSKVEALIYLLEVEFDCELPESVPLGPQQGDIIRANSVVRFSTPCFSTNQEDSTDIFVTVASKDLTASETIDCARSQLRELFKGLASELEDENWNGKR